MSQVRRILLMFPMLAKQCQSPATSVAPPRRVQQVYPVCNQL